MGTEHIHNNTILLMLTEATLYALEDDDSAMDEIYFSHLHTPLALSDEYSKVITRLDRTNVRSQRNIDVLQTLRVNIVQDLITDHVSRLYQALLSRTSDREPHLIRAARLLIGLLVDNDDQVLIDQVSAYVQDKPASIDRLLFELEAYCATH